MVGLARSAIGRQLSFLREKLYQFFLLHALHFDHLRCVRCGFSCRKSLKHLKKIRLRCLRFMRCGQCVKFQARLGIACVTCIAWSWKPDLTN